MSKQIAIFQDNVLRVYERPTHVGASIIPVNEDFDLLALPRKEREYIVVSDYVPSGAASRPPVTPFTIGTAFDTDLSGWTITGDSTNSWQSDGGRGVLQAVCEPPGMFSTQAIQAVSTGALTYQYGGVLLFEVGYKLTTTGSGTSFTNSFFLRNADDQDLIYVAGSFVQINDPSGNYVASSSLLFINDYLYGRVEVDTFTNQYREFSSVDAVTWTPGPWQPCSLAADWQTPPSSDQYFLHLNQIGFRMFGAGTVTYFTDIFRASIA